MIKIPFQILGKDWVIKLYTQKAYNAKHGKGSLAVTKGWKRCIELSPKGYALETIVHELVHAYVVELCSHNDELSVSALEELYCELMAKRGKELLELADALDGTVKRLTLSR